MDQSNAQEGQEPIIEENEEAEFEELSMEALLAQSDISLNIPRVGETRTGMIASVSDDEVLVSIGTKSEGLIPSRELSQLEEEERAKLVVGEEITVFIVSPEGRSGTMILSLQRAKEEGDWGEAERLRDAKEVYEGQIAGYNKGGLIVKLGSLRGFIPASQVSLTRRMSYQGDTPEQRWSAMTGENIMVRVIEVDRQRRRLILSEKAAVSESRETLKERLMEEIDIGEVRTGKVTSLAEFGAFVNLQGADGLVHLSEISWEHIKHPNELLKVGDEVKVKIISLDRERKRIGLSIRQCESDPWEEYVADYKVGQLIEGEITRITKFGAFAKVDDNIEGLIHISEISDKRIEHPKEVLEVGDVMALRIIKIDTERRRVGLSVSKVESMKYSDMDWQMALAEMNSDGEKAEAPAVEEPVEEEAEKETTDEAEVVEEAADDVVEETAEEAVVEETDDSETSVDEETADEAVEEETTDEAVVEETAEEVVEETTDEAEEETVEEVVEETTDEAEEETTDEDAEEETTDEAVEEETTEE